VIDTDDRRAVHVDNGRAIDTIDTDDASAIDGVRDTFIEGNTHDLRAIHTDNRRGMRTDNGRAIDTIDIDDMRAIDRGINTYDKRRLTRYKSEA